MLFDILMRILKASIFDYDESFYRDAFLYLSGDRQQKALRYRNAADRLSCILGDYLLRKAVSEETGIDLNRVCLSHTANGKPCVAHPENSGLHVSLSHSDGFVIIAIDTSPVGIDIEAIRDVDDAVKKHVLSQAESEYAGKSRARFFEVWTMK